MQLNRLLPMGYAIDIYLLSVMSSLTTANARFLLGKDHIKGFNTVFMVQGGLLFFVLSFFYFVLHLPNFQSYLRGLYCTYGLALAISFYLVIPVIRQDRTEQRHTPSGRLALLLEKFGSGLGKGAANVEWSRQPG